MGKSAFQFLVVLLISTAALAQSQQQAASDEARRQGITAQEIPRWQALQAAAAPAAAASDTPRIVVDWTKIDFTTVDTCANRDAEQNFATWKLLEGNFTAANVVTLKQPATPPAASTTARFAVTPISGWQSPPGFDPTVGTRTPQIPVTIAGNHSFRLGNAVNGGQAEAMYQAFTVTPLNASFAVDYAVVLEDPGHDPGIQPFVGIYFYDVTNQLSPQLITYVERVSSSNDPFFHRCDRYPPTDPRNCINDRFVWREVSCFRADLSAYIGKPVVAMYVSADCGAGGHFGYAYFDGKCGPPVPPTLNVNAAGFCPTGGPAVTATATSTVAVVNNTWTIVQTDSSGANAVPSTQASQTFNGAIVSPKDLTALYGAQGRRFECGKYYKVTLSITTECGSNSASKVVFIDCPPEPVISGPVDVCTNGTYCVKPRRGTAHTWSVQGGTPSSTTGTCITVTWGPTGPYSINVTATSIAGCKITKKIDIKPCDCCKGTNFTTGQTSLIGGANGIYTLSSPLTLTGFGPVTQVTAAIVSATITPASPGCGVAGPVPATIASGSTVVPFNGPLLNAIPGTEVGWTSNTPININGQSFPFQIQLPAPLPAPCADIVSFCVRYTFTGSCGPGQAGCRSCSFVVCHRVIRSCDSIIWPDSLITTLTSQLQQEID